MIKINENPKLVERFCKDTKIPINIFVEPYFSERLEELNKIMPEKNWSMKWDNFCEMLKDFNNEQEYFEYYNALKDQSIAFIKDSEGFKRFNEDDMNKYKNHIKENHPNLYKEIYNDDAIGKKFISFDLMSANFNALRHYDSLIFGDNNIIAWSQFLSKMGCKYDFILDSKYIRQVILGNCNPGRQMTYTGWLAEQVLDVINDFIPELKLVNFTTDELIFEIPDKFLQEDDKKFNYDNLAYVIENKVNIPVKAEAFILRKVEGELNGWIKDIYDYEFSHKCRTEYKGINGDFAYLTIYLINRIDDPTGIRASVNDLVFNYNGHLAKLLNVPKFKIRENGPSGYKI